MDQATVGKITISPLHLGTCFAYKLCGDQIESYWLGLVRIRKIPLQEILEFRLAARGEPSWLSFALNHVLYYLWRPAYKPIYLLRTRKKWYFLKLDHDSQRKLRVAIKRIGKSRRRLEKAA